MDQRVDWPRIEALFDAALELEEGERAGFVQSQTDDPAILEEVLSLLASAGHAQDFLETEDAPAEPLLTQGQKLGAWRIASLVGRGGMGDVYKVDRADGLYEQTAALKVMRPGPSEDTALFESERRYLARLEHPNIARLLDGGVTAQGRPWMVMELAEGASADAWASRSKAPARLIVEKMLQAGEALAYAHDKLIVHRDVKPSNIMIDAGGRARVIDFGVARLASADKGQSAPLSLDYAAPELLEGQPATTASDVYGLAATLYALLAGHPPLRLSDDPLPVALRRAMEEPPARLPAQRFTRRDKSLLRDLDHVLARALAKQPAGRYPTVNSFCEDLRAALKGRPVAARASERGYVLGRYIKRHRWQAAAAAALVISLVGGLSASLWQAREARIERDWAQSEQARLEAVQHYLFFMLRDGADVSGGTSASAREILEAAAAQVGDLFAADPERGGQVMHALAELYFYLNDYEAAGPLLRQLVEADYLDPALLASARYDLAQVLLRTVGPDEAEPLLAQAQAFWQSDSRQWRRRLVDSRLVEARILRDRGRLPEAVALLERTVPDRIALSGETDRMTGVVHNDLGVMLFSAGRMEDAAASLREALAVWRATGLADGPDALNTLNNLAAVQVLSGDHAAAEPLFREIVEIRRAAYGPSATTAAVLNNYGKTLINLDRADEALPHLREAVSMAREHAGLTSFAYAAAVAGHSEAKAATGDPEQALLIAGQAYDAILEATGAPGPASSIVAIALARTLADEGHIARAETLLAEAEEALGALGPAAGMQMQAIATIRTRHGLEG
ncbi:serine/threonine protein kinase [Alkalicaulis satelles]|uniref:Serine/threonine protein kinase n=1 Tax=Alkalicaulis satelles TaxID=2609175 RepID=A0A5M6ZNX6_9PROT|nr:serine/threonine-protein kinase [Alkalicaulis satelles]KAA5805417.1 serine/threonine protein kinase [Alkalicaulis satelles]